MRRDRRSEVGSGIWYELEWHLGELDKDGSRALIQSPILPYSKPVFN